MGTGCGRAVRRSNTMAGCRAGQGRDPHVVFPEVSNFENADVPLIVRHVRLMKVVPGICGAAAARKYVTTITMLHSRSCP